MQVHRSTSLKLILITSNGEAFEHWAVVSPRMMPSFFNCANCGRAACSRRKQLEALS